MSGFWDYDIIGGIRKFFARPKKHEPGFVRGITPGDARSRISAISGWSWNGGIVQSWTGSKYPGALSYPGLWSLDYTALRRRSRIAYWESLQARALLGRLVDNVVGHGLVLEATPAWGLVNPKASEDEKRQWTRDVETRFHLWAMSKEVDASGNQNLYQLTRFAFLNQLRDGEIINILRSSPDKGRMNPTEVQFVQPEQLVSPMSDEAIRATKARGNRIVDGIEITASGRPEAYYIHDDIIGRDVRIPAIGPKSKRRFVNHAPIIDMVGQVRGVPVLAPLVHELQKLTDYQLSEIEAAVVNATIAAYIKPSEDRPASRAFAGIALRNTEAEESETTAATTTGPPAPAYIERPGLLIQNLKAGEDIASFKVDRPNVHYEEFVTAVKSSLSASLGIPIEVLDMSFNQNYSASRASLLLFWTVVTNWRAILASDFLTVIYEAWMTEEVSAGRIKAPGFEQPVLHAAWLNCDWVGVPHPSIDPSKEATAVDTRIAAGLTTRERAAREYNGSEFSENVERLAVENEELAKANKSVAKKEAVPAQIPDSGDDETDRNNGNGSAKSLVGILGE